MWVRGRAVVLDGVELRFLSLGNSGGAVLVQRPTRENFLSTSLTDGERRIDSSTCCYHFSLKIPELG
jgi:hypothetical protein